MIKPVTIFLTPKPEDPSQALVVAFPENVWLFIDVDVDDRGNQTVVEVDEVIWQYSKVPPAGSNLPPFLESPEPIDINAEVRLPPENTPFGLIPVVAAAPSLLAEVEVELPNSETASYENIGINPLVPNKPRLDSAPEPAESSEFATAAAGQVIEGPDREYEYAVILTSRTNIYALDPKVIIRRRHTRRSL